VRAHRVDPTIDVTVKTVVRFIATGENQASFARSRRAWAHCRPEATEPQYES